MSELYKKLFNLIKGYSVVVVCVGTDKVGGDCLGPLVGQMLRHQNVPAFVYGTLEKPITALNVNEFGEYIRKKHPKSVIVAVDSAVGSAFEEGQVCVSGSPLLPGLAGGKHLNPIGDINVTAVTTSYAPSHQGFLAVGLGFVYPLAAKVARLIGDCVSHAAYFAPESPLASLASL